MSEPRLITGLAEIAPDHDALICDIWGVVHNGHAPFPEAAEALRHFRRERGPVVLLSNAPRLPDSVVKQFHRLGVATDCCDAIVTSGGATREELEKRGPLSLYYIGPDWDQALLDRLPIRQTGIADAELAVCVGLKDDLTETPEDYAGVLAEMRAKGLLMLCANPDLKVYRGKQLCWCAGALAQAYEELGGKVAYYGKPYPAIYRAALKAAGEPKKPLAIGDALVTDLKGAQGAGMEALFIADGLHGEEIEPYTARHLGEMFAVHHVSAKAAMRALKW
ncbi:MAG TPA: TIGR01459 family HAD-type hydrolase [Rhizomicrobium sp.]|nr:TIGR01459 family HAD-type hydrolase [Rhizomicrobium sp.]